MDYIWVPNNQNKLVLINDGIKEDKIKVIPHTFDLSLYRQEAKKINLYAANNKFKFYYVGDLNDRKNISCILRCFYSEFTNGEDVCLVLKLKKHGVNPDRLKEQFLKAAGSMKEKLRIHKRPEYYPQEIILTADANDTVIHDIHNTCDCYVSPSHGEAWSIPAFEAMCYGKTPICSNEGGPKEFINNNDRNTGTLVNGTFGVCSHSDPAFPDIFTGKEEWFIPNERDVKQAMRWYYENRYIIDREAGLNQASQFSYESIGQKIKDVLDE
jgi:glycosyltransferase involved in cell wall biosynthesis